MLLAGKARRQHPRNARTPRAMVKLRAELATQMTLKKCSSATLPCRLAQRSPSSRSTGSSKDLVTVWVQCQGGVVDVVEALFIEARHRSDDPLAIRDPDFILGRLSRGRMLPPERA